MSRAGRTLPTGIVRTATGFRAFVWVPWPGYPDGRVRSKRFTRTATYEPTIKEAEEWREDRRVEARRKQADDPVPVGTGFLADAETYLEAVQAMLGFKDRRRHMREWAALFGERPRDEVHPHEIRAQRDRWLTVGPKRVLVKPAGEKARWEVRPIPLSASSVNHRLRALENFYTVLGGRDGYNPVREVDEAEPPEELPKGQTFALAYEILAHMPDVTTPKKGGAVEKGSLSRVRFETMLVTGFPAKQLGMLLPEHVNWDVPSVTPPKRLKGRRRRRARARRQVKPRQLMPAAVPVLRRFFAMGANRQFSSTSLGRSIKRAIRSANTVRARLKLPPIPETLRPYDLTRHTFGTEVFRLTQNVLLVKDLLGHATIEQSERYAMAAIQEHQVTSVAELSAVARRARLAAKRPGKVGGKVSPRKRSGRVRTVRRRGR
jgi:site-specific recombinase XerD